MATIEQRRIGDGRVVYRVKVRLKGHPQATATFERKTDAKKWAQDTESDIRRNRYFQFTEAKRHTVGEMIDRYLRDELPQKRSQRDTVRQLKWWDEQIGGHTLADASPALIAEYRDKLAKSETLRGARRSPSTVNRYLAALSHAFTVAVKEWQWLDANPLTKVRKSKEPRGRTQFLSEEERKRLLEACKRRSHSLLYPVVVLALSTGARKGELLALRWRDIDLKRGVVRIEESKNDERRALPLAGHALEQIQRLNKVRRIDSELVFPSHKDPAKPANIENLWKAARTEARLEDFRFHDLRHSAASYLAMSGATLAEIAEVLGHKTLQMVKRYAHLTEQHTAGVVARMNEKIFG